MTDYSATTRRVKRVTNSEFVDLMDSPQAGREAWARVRWINIGGVSWDVMSALSVKYRQSHCLPWTQCLLVC